MRIEWTYPAETYFDQLPVKDQLQVTRAFERLPAAWDELLKTGALKRLDGPEADLHSLRAGGEVRVLVRLSGNVITVVDVIRRSQIEALRRLARLNEPAAE